MSKWKVLIADDEFIIRDGIRTFVNWADFHMEVVAEAEDGEEAVEQALANQIDVVLIDLNMPIMNGITAMKKIKEKLPGCRMVVISGYDDFRYAQEAIRLQVEDYLLKPVDPDQLAGILTELMTQLERDREEEQFFQQASVQVEKNQLQLRNRFFQDLLSSNLSKTEVLHQLQFFHLPPTLPCSLLVLKWQEGEAGQHFMKEEKQHIQKNDLQKSLEIKLQDYTYAMYSEESQWITIFLWEQLPEQVVVEIENTISEELGQHLFGHLIPISNVEIASNYHEAKQVVNQRVKSSPLVKEALAYLRRHYQDPHLTLEEIASLLHVSTVYLSKSIKQELGVSYVQILTKMRLQAAKDLLKTTDYTIREIAEQVGYDSQHYFSTAFRKAMGVTPKQFKQQV
ncbi:response regulator transcription factor [Gracilibacillus salinarum]|uniref:Response regulator n=1 Tax=Gracilibacillus salinarum TaxID=2932255 RepID=A0ABY4GIV2_9BACI|nr:response regulator [Gracilibacillus salinarum]UOQ84138.1 response regulator [Gracilibacillus salinarum]